MGIVVDKVEIDSRKNGKVGDKNVGVGVVNSKGIVKIDVENDGEAVLVN